MFASLTECSGLSQSGGHLVLWYMSFLVISFLCFLESCLSAHLWTMAFSHLSWGEHIEGFTDLRNLVLADSPHPLARSALPLAHYITSMSWVLFQGATFSLTSGPLHMLFFFPAWNTLSILLSSITYPSGISSKITFLGDFTNLPHTRVVSLLCAP